MCFVNKMDRMGANFYNCVEMIKIGGRRSCRLAGADAYPYFP